MRHRKPTALLKLQGTYRANRHEDRIDDVITDIVPAASGIKVPEEIKDEYVQHYFKTQVTFLEKLGLLQESDVPHLTQMFLLLEQVRKVNKQVEEYSVKGIINNLEIYEKLIKLMTRLTDKYNTIATKYYITPLARTKLTLDALNIEKLKIENPSIVSKLLEKKKA